MSVIRKERRDLSKREIKEFSHENQDEIGILPNGQSGVVKRDWHTMLASETQGRIYYSPIKNKYYVAEDSPVSKEQFEDQFLPYLSWDYDQFEQEEVMVEAEDAKGKVKEVGTGKFRVINKFPPTPENIAAKRKELLNKAFEDGESVSSEDIQMKTLPRTLLNDDMTTDGRRKRRFRR